MPCQSDKTCFSLMALLIALLAVAQSAAQSPSYPPKPKWSVTPGVVRQSQGKYPGTVTAVLFLNDCQPDKNGKTPLVVVDSTTTATFKIAISGSGVTASGIVVGDCTLTASLAIDSSAQPGDQKLMVSSAPKSSSVFTDDGYGILWLADATAGPTPGQPEVDVMWDVMSDHVCSDDFGNHLPKFLYCIEVKIGNNSAHSLQLAGIGFKRPNPFANTKGLQTDKTLISPNTSYQTSRAVAQAGTTTTARNLIYNSVQALGLVMASFTPFFHNTHNSFRWSTGASIVSGAVLQGIAMVAPDLTLKELNNLDDQSFRDGKLIPNNTQVRMIVFVDRRVIAETTWSVCEALYPNDPKKCKKDPNPTVVRVALGDLVIVGNSIDFLQRVVVDTSVTSQEVVSPPTITLQPKSQSVAST